MSTNSSNHLKRRSHSAKVELICDCGCGVIFYRYKNKIGPKLNFLNPQHRGAYHVESNMREKAGSYLLLFREYLEGPAKRFYSSEAFPRKNVLPFFCLS